MDNLTIQYLLVGIIVLIALVYLTKKVRNSLKGKSSCSKGCGCDSLKNSSLEPNNCAHKQV